VLIIKSERNMRESELRLVASDYFSNVKASLLRETIQSLINGQNEMKKEVEAHKKAREELFIEKNRAESATHLKDKFVSLVAHDLRSPFTSILGILAMVLKDKSEPVSGKHRQMIERVLNSGESLVKIIENILDVSKLQSGEIVPQRMFFILNEIVGNVLEKHLPMAEEKGVTIMNDVPVTNRIYADPDLLAEVLSNLINNAIKFSNEGCVVRIFSSAENASTIIVSDTGIGISDEQKSKIFNSEIRVTSKGTAGEIGTGLGLSFCKDIIKAHKGEINVESVEGSGTIFFIELPEVVPRAILYSQRGELGELYEKLMVEHGILVEESDNLQHALEISLTDEEFHLAIIDADTKGGFDFVRRLKISPKFADNPIILLSSDESGDAIEEARACGIRTFVKKPMSKEEFRAKIRKIFP